MSINTPERYQHLEEILSIISRGEVVPRELIKSLRSQSIETTFLTNFSNEKFIDLLSILPNLRKIPDQLDIIATISNILRSNDQLKSSDDKDILSALKLIIPHLYNFLNFISERQINSESQYKEFLPIFRLFFLLSHNNHLLSNLRDSILRISKKLLNFVALSSSESFNLNSIIIEILNIVYIYIYQEKDMTGLDSSFVLSCNKFNMLYFKAKPSKEYDEILTSFGNLLLNISTSISQHYSLNKLKFVVNQVTLINRYITSKALPTPLSKSPSSNILVLSVLITIDYEDSGIRGYIKENLNFDLLSTCSISTTSPELTSSISQLIEKLREGSSSPLTPPLSIPQIISPIFKIENDTNPLEDIIKNGSHCHTLGLKEPNETSSYPRFDELNKPKDIASMKEFFDKIEKNGMLKMKTK